MAHYYVQILKPSKPWLNLSDLCTSSLSLMKLTRQTCSTTYRDQRPGIQPPTTFACATTRGQRPLELSHASPQILDSQLGSQPHTPPRRPCHPPIYLTWESGGHTNLHAPTRAVGVFVSSPCAGSRLPRAERLLLMSSDVIRWRHLSTSTCHISNHARPSPR